MEEKVSKSNEAGNSFYNILNGVFPFIRWNPFSWHGNPPKSTAEKNNMTSQQKKECYLSPKRKQ